MDSWYNSFSDSTLVNYNLLNSTVDYGQGFIVLSGIFTGMTLLETLIQVPFVLYCMVKVAIKAPTTSSKVLCALVMISYLGFRSIFFPVFIAYFPFPPDVEIMLPKNWLAICVLIASVLYICFWVLPVFLLMHQWRTTEFRKENVVYDQQHAPLMMVVMPIYNEEPEILQKAIISVVENRYPKTKIKLFLSFDDESESPLFLSTMKFLSVSQRNPDDSYSRLINVTFRGVQIVICRFPHGGKRMTQSNTFQLLDTYLMGSRETALSKEPLLLLIDSDVVLDPFSMAHFVAEMEKTEKAEANASSTTNSTASLKVSNSRTELNQDSNVEKGHTDSGQAKQHRKCLALTGLILCSKTEHWNPLVLLQDVEYTHMQMLNRLLESTLGAVTCLPGAFTVVRYDAFRKSATQYFRSIRYDDLFDYMRYYLGEDRYLTHIFMEEFERYQIQFCYSAFCKTVAPSGLPTLFKQRRRWYLGAITNQLILLSIPSLWVKYPLVLVVTFINEVLRHSSVFGYVLIMHVIVSWKEMTYTLGCILGPLFINWFCLGVYAFHLRRYKSIFLYPILYAIQPIFSWTSTIYSILTSHSYTWGGPRTVTFQQSSEKKWGSQLELDKVAKMEKWIIEDDIVRMY